MYLYSKGKVTQVTIIKSFRKQNKFFQLFIPSIFLIIIVYTYNIRMLMESVKVCNKL